MECSVKETISIHLTEPGSSIMLLRLSIFLGLLENLSSENGPEKFLRKDICLTDLKIRLEPKGGHGTSLTINAIEACGTFQVTLIDNQVMNINAKWINWTVPTVTSATLEMRSASTKNQTQSFLFLVLFVIGCSLKEKNWKYILN